MSKEYIKEVSQIGSVPFPLRDIVADDFSAPRQIDWNLPPGAHVPLDYDISRSPRAAHSGLYSMMVKITDLGETPSGIHVVKTVTIEEAKKILARIFARTPSDEGGQDVEWYFNFKGKSPVADLLYSFALRIELASGAVNVLNQAGNWELLTFLHAIGADHWCGISMEVDTEKGEFEEIRIGNRTIKEIPIEPYSETDYSLYSIVEFGIVYSGTTVPDAAYFDDLFVAPRV